LTEKNRGSDPKASRPNMPGYGMMFQGDWKALPWTWAVGRLSGAHNYWVATTRKDGRPHVMPIWGIWLDCMFYFSTGRRSRKSRNLAANPSCVICPEGAGEAVILEGLADELRDSNVRRQVRDAYKKKYDSDLDSYSADPIYAVRPRVVFGLVESSDKIRGNPTRWSFSTSC
jgi:nitroimidazol reductase NimA-like FMN-containing flavoprotein (pyridoxamine 5'-phosphate oxidase superfamily)